MHWHDWVLLFARMRKVNAEYPSAYGRAHEVLRQATHWGEETQLLDFVDAIHGYLSGTLQPDDDRPLGPDHPLYRKGTDPT